MKKHFIKLLLLATGIVPITSYAEQHTTQSDEHLRGYVQSIFVHSYGLPKDSVAVKDGIIIIDEQKIDGSNPDQIIEKTNLATQHLNKKNIRQDKFVDIAMPGHSLFQPLIADPKWPRFTVAYQRYLKDGAIKSAFAPNFGASFPLYRIVKKETHAEWEIGVQAGLFGLMDIGTKPSALINADYYIAIPVTYSTGAWSGLIRGYHLSSHLGDEFMLTPEGKKTKRINLSYEGVDALLSYNFNSFRLYGGGGYLINRDPKYIKPRKVQVGGEYYWYNTFFNGKLRPVAGIDIKSEEMSRWYPGISCKVGVQLENAALISNKVQFMLEYYSGKSIHGQFYNNKVRYIGFGIQGFL